MLHMLVNVHNAESCAFRSEEDDAALTPALEQLKSAAADTEVTLKSWWVNTGSHTFFILLDAPNAHAIDKVIRETGLVGRTHSSVYAIVDMTDLMEEQH